MRPIDADALKMVLSQSFNDPELVIDDVPTIDLAPVVHGEWLPLEEPQWNCFGLITIGYRCSECGREEPYNNEPYCHCGAKMDGGKTDGRKTD